MEKVNGENPNILCEQVNVFRTNCMDCLDRTNVVQSTVARFFLTKQLLRFGVDVVVDHGLDSCKEFEQVFNHMWANNGDAISRIYTGTPALKGDFTRFRRRNIQGIVADGVSSLSRLYLNTFTDATKQLAIDYLLGLNDLHQYEQLMMDKSLNSNPHVANSGSNSKDILNFGAEQTDYQRKMAGKINACVLL
jgi:hypothetical protein